ncbi:MAG: sulfotransferase [Thalassospira sp.]|uniref:sulfotransferase n=1 Tax=Thalassospira sp. TaxID=1912094 RepID=UPI003A8A9154
MSSGNVAAAAQHYEASCSVPATTPDCFFAFAELLKKIGKPDLAEEVLNVGSKKWPDNALMLRELGVALAENDSHSQAMTAFDNYLKLEPEDWIGWNHLGCARAQNNHADQALACFDQSLLLIAKHNPKNATSKDVENVRLNKANAMIQAGKTFDARRTLEDVLKENPDSHRAWYELSNLVKCTPQQITRMESCLERVTSVGNQDAMRDLHFALGRAWDQANAPEKSIDHLNQGNKIVRTALTYNSQEVCGKVRHTPHFFPPSLFLNISKKASEKPTGFRPVFIVGMPRSGSTLTEQILSAHPDVIGAGELTTLPNICKTMLGSNFASCPEHMKIAASPETHEKIRNVYLAELKRIASDLRPDADIENGNIVVVDKMLGNFDMIGMIVQAIPEARIVHCRRNPIDTCLSCYSMLFRSPVNYSYNQTELAEFYKAYDDQMHYWHETIPSSVLMETKYEDMVADTEHQARKLLEFVDLPWDETVLNFHRNKRSVSTASMVQVRKPIYNSSVKRWKPYAPYIQPMLSVLGDK